MATKLEIEIYKAVSAEILLNLEKKVNDSFSEFMAFCRRDSVYIIALAQMRRAQEKQDEKGMKK